MSFCREVINELENEGIGVFGDDIFLGTSPQKSGAQLTVYDTGGNPPRKDNTKLLTFQFMSKAEKYVDAEDLIKVADEVVRERYYCFFGDYLVLLLEGRGEPGSIGRDENERHMFSSNYNARIRKINY